MSVNRELNNARENIRSSSNDSNGIIVIVTVCSIVSAVFFLYATQYIVHSFLDSITSDVGGYMTLMMCFHRFACLRQYYHRLSHLIDCLVLITTYLALGWCNRCFEHIRSMKDNQRKKKFFFSFVYCTYKCLSRDRKTMDHLFCVQ